MDTEKNDNILFTLVNVDNVNISIVDMEKIIYGELYLFFSDIVDVIKFSSAKLFIMKLLV